MANGNSWGDLVEIFKRPENLLTLAGILAPRVTIGPGARQRIRESGGTAFPQSLLAMGQLGMQQRQEREQRKGLLSIIKAFQKGGSVEELFANLQTASPEVLASAMQMLPSLYKMQHPDPWAVPPGGAIVDPTTREPIYRAPEKLMGVPPGGVVYDPATKTTPFTAPERLVPVPKGGTLFDPSTKQPVYTAPSAPETIQQGIVEKLRAGQQLLPWEQAYWEKEIHGIPGPTKESLEDFIAGRPLSPQKQAIVDAYLMRLQSPVSITTAPGGITTTHRTIKTPQEEFDYHYDNAKQEIADLQEPKGWFGGLLPPLLSASKTDQVKRLPIGKTGIERKAYDRAVKEFLGDIPAEVLPKRPQQPLGKPQLSPTPTKGVQPRAGGPPSTKEEIAAVKEMEKHAKDIVNRPDVTYEQAVRVYQKLTDFVMKSALRSAIREKWNKEPGFGE